MKNKTENSELEEEKDDSELDPEEDPEEEREEQDESEEEIEEQEDEEEEEEIEEQEASEEEIEEEEDPEEEIEQQEASEEEVEEQEVSEEEIEEQEDPEEEIVQEDLNKKPEEDPEEDVDEGSEEDPSEVDPDEDPSEEDVSDDKQRADSSSAVCYSESNPSKEDPHGKSVKKRRTRWEPQPEKGESIVLDLNPKRRKTRWDIQDSPKELQLPNNELNLKLVEINRKILACSLPDGTIKAGRRRREHCQKLIRERQRIFDELLKDKKSSSAEMFFKKLYIPVNKYPSYNFVGLILGPQGNTLKSMEKETGAKILLRGKNSSMKPDAKDDPSFNEDLHVQIKANNQKSLDSAVQMVEKLLVPKDDHQNEHKLAQLKELAILRGNFRDENRCRICNEQGHLAFACPQGSSTLKAVISCDMCGSLAHLKSSCPSLSKKPNKEKDESNLYVGYLPKVVDDSRLREMFAPFGKIVSSVVVKDKNTGQSKGYGFVKFDSIIDAASAVKLMDKCQIDGHSLAVRVAGEPQAAVLPPLAPLPVYPRPAPPLYGGSAMAAQAAWPGQPSSTHYGQMSQYGSTIMAPPPFISGVKKSNAEESTSSLLSKFPGDPDYPGSKLF